MSKYGKAACLATQKVRNGSSPKDAWEDSVKAIFPEQAPSRNKSCPRCAFLGLAGAGLIIGVPPGNYTRSRDNARYAVNAAYLLRECPRLYIKANILWRCIMSNEENTEKAHNNQMDVVMALWKNDYIEHLV